MHTSKAVKNYQDLASYSWVTRLQNTHTHTYTHTHTHTVISSAVWVKHVWRLASSILHQHSMYISKTTQNYQDTESCSWASRIQTNPPPTHPLTHPPTHAHTQPDTDQWAPYWCCQWWGCEGLWQQHTLHDGTHWSAGPQGWADPSPCG